MTEISISQEMTAAGVAVGLGCVQARVAVAEENAMLDQALDLEAARCRERLAETAAAEVRGVAAARRAFKALGKDPSRYRVSTESLLRRLAQGKGLYRINTVVDTNNLVSLHTGISAGTYRLAALCPPLVLRKGAPGESYAAIGRGELNLENLPVLADRVGPFGSPASDSERSRITPETDRVLMVLYGFEAGPDFASALAFAADCLRAYCAATEIETALVTANG